MPPVRAQGEDGFETLSGRSSNPETVSTDYDTSDKLFFEPPAATRGRAAHLRAGEVLGGDRAVRRADAAESRAGLAKERGEHHRHVAAEHRGGRGPQAVRGDAPQARHSATAQRSGHERSRSPRGGARSGLPGAGAAIVRARRPRDADRLFRFGAGPLHAVCGRGVSRASRAGGQVPRGRDRGGCGLHSGRGPFRRGGAGDDSHRRHPGAHRIRRGAFRGRGDGPAAAYVIGESHRDNPRGIRACDGAGIEGDRIDERAIRRQGRHGVCALCVNPRASRTVPFVSKAIGVPLAKLAGEGDGRQDACRSWVSRRRSGPSIGR